MEKLEAADFDIKGVIMMAVAPRSPLCHENSTI